MSFSKKIAVTVLVTYVLAVLAGIYCLLFKDANLTEFFAFVSAPTAVILAFYFNKAKAENTVGGITYDQSFCEEEEDK